MNTSDGITVTRIEAVNVLKFDRFELDNPSKLTLIRGANNQGKTTVLRLLGLAVRGADGDAARVIHDGAAKGNVALSLSNGYTLRRSFTPKGEYFDILDEKGHKVPSPQKFVNDWLGEYRDFNPLAWLSMDPKEQVRVLLQAIDVRLTPEEFTSSTGLDAPFDVDFAQHGLMVLDALRAHYAEERKLGNRIADEKKKAAAVARRALPTEKPTITEEQRAEAVRVREAAHQARQGLETRALAASNHAAAVERIEREQQRHRDEFARDEAEVKELQQRIQRIRDRQAELVKTIAVLDGDLATLASSAPPTDEEKGAVNAQIKQANVLTTAIAAAERTLAQFADVERLEQEASDAAAAASIIDTTIKTLDTIVRASLMKKAALPVDNLTIEDGRILVNGHELQFLAESQRIRIAVAIARALRPALRVIVLDDAAPREAAAGREEAEGREGIPV
jgi:hypothetical protein